MNDRGLVNLKGKPLSRSASEPDLFKYSISKLPVRPKTASASTGGSPANPDASSHLTDAVFDQKTSQPNLLKTLVDEVAADPILTDLIKNEKIMGSYNKENAALISVRHL